ncbi:MAG: hypothetical protein ACOC3D_04600, partial [Pseudomonadota bacterium]
MPPSGRAIRAGRASVELFADDSRLVRGLRRARRRLLAFGAQVQRIGRRIAAVGATIAAGFGATAAVFAKVGDNLDKLSQRTGVSVESLSQLEFAADQTGSSLNDLGGALRRMNRRLGRITAGQGSSTQVNALEALGLSAERLEQLSPEQRLLAIADAVANFGDQSEAAGLAQRAFGAQVDAILPLLLQGSEGIRELMREADTLGLTVSTEDAAAAAELSDAFGELVAVVKRTVFQLGAALAPVLIDAINLLSEVAGSVRRWVEEQRGLVVILAATAAVVTVVGGVITGIGIAIVAVVAVMTALAKIAAVAVIALKAILSPIGLLITALAALGGAILTFSGAAGDAIAWLGEKFGELGDDAGTALDGIRDALANGNIEQAAEILWLGLQTVWARGTAALGQLWGTFSQTFLRIALRAFDAVGSFFVDAISGIRLALVDLQSWLRRFFADLVSRFQTTGALIQNLAVKAGNEARGLVDDDFDEVAANRRADTRLAERVRESDRQLRSAQGDARSANRADRERVLATRERLQGRLDEFVSETIAGSFQAQEDAGREAAAEAEKLRRELEASVRQAKEERDAERDGLPGSRDRRLDLDAFRDEIQSGVEAANAGATARGGFDARTLALTTGPQREERETAE